DNCCALISESVNIFKDKITGGWVCQQQCCLHHPACLDHLRLHADPHHGDVCPTVIVCMHEKACLPDVPITHLDDSAVVLLRIREILGMHIGELVSTYTRIKGWGGRPHLLSAVLEKG
ncbi:hypothetical protein BDQ12DRAFT_618766, partial [Crucibulum laeve]